MDSENKLFLGTFLSLGSPVVAEVCGKYPHVVTPEIARKPLLFALGCTHQAVDSDLGILRRRRKELTTR